MKEKQQERWRIDRTSKIYVSTPPNRANAFIWDHRLVNPKTAGQSPNWKGPRQCVHSTGETLNRLYQ
jgi:hypothetical protein